VHSAFHVLLGFPMLVIWFGFELWQKPNVLFVRLSLFSNEAQHCINAIIAITLRFHFLDKLPHPTIYKEFRNSSQRNIKNIIYLVVFLSLILFELYFS